MQAPPINPPFSPEPYGNPPVKKLRAGGTPPHDATAPPPTPAPTMPLASSSFSSSSSAAAATHPPPHPPSGGRSFTARVDDAVSSRRAELMRLRQKTAQHRAAGGSAPPSGNAASAPPRPGVPGKPQPSAETLLERARSQLPPPRAAAAAGTGGPPPSQQQPPPAVPAPDGLHYRRTSDIFPEVTSKVDAPLVPKPAPPVLAQGSTHPPPPAAPTPAPPPPFTPGPTPVVVRNLDSSFGALDADAGPPKKPPPPSGPSPPSASRAKSAPPQRPPPPPPGSASPSKDPHQAPSSSRRPPPPVRPKPEVALPSSAAAPPKGPPPGPPPQPSSHESTHTTTPSFAEGNRGPAASTPAPLSNPPKKPPPPSSSRPPSSSSTSAAGLPNGDSLDTSSAHSTRSTGSQRSTGNSGAPTPPTSPAAAAAPPRGPPPRQPGAPPPGPLHHHHPTAAATATSSGWVAPPYSPGSVRAAVQQPPPMLGPPRLTNEPAADDVADESSRNHHQRALLSGAETPPMHNLSAELRLQSELAQVQRDKAEALRRVVELEERLAEAAERRQLEQEQSQRPENGDRGEDAIAAQADWSLLQEAVRVAEARGGQEALDWARQRWPRGPDDGGDGSVATPALRAPPRAPASLPRPRRPADAAALSPESVQAAVERVEHEYEADCATFVVRRPMGMAGERELWFQAGQLPAKRYAAAASVSRVDTVEVVAIVRADQSLLAVHGPRGARHESNGQWHDFGGVLELGEPLGFVSVVDSEGTEIQYSLDEVYEGAVAVREHYCLAVLSTAVGLQSAKELPNAAPPAASAGKNAETRERGVGTEDLTQGQGKESGPASTRAEESPDSSGQFFGLLIGGLWWLIYSLVSIVLRIVISTFVSAMCVVLLSIFWVYMADESLVPVTYLYNRPGVV